MQRIKKYENWGRNWKLIIPGNFPNDVNTDLLFFYDPLSYLQGGVGEIYRYYKGGSIKLLTKYETFRRTWKLIVPGAFGGSNGIDLLFYDPSYAGSGKWGIGEIYTCSEDSWSLVRVHNNWRRVWEMIIPGDFGGQTGYTDLLFYDPNSGEIEIYKCNGGGRIELMKKYENWGRNWKLIVPGKTRHSGYTDLLFYDPFSHPSGGVIEIYRCYKGGNIEMVKRYENGSRYWKLITSGFIRTSKFFGKEFLFYDPFSHPSGGVIEIYRCSSNGTMGLWRRHEGLSRYWKLIIPGDFADRDHTAFLFYDPFSHLKGGLGEFYRFDL
ncbi:MAG: hypothetical protein HXS48_21780 [Theionarchaea archaeon]|nr:hypothetical protein [Theionarchaea archaeon]